MLKSWIAAAKRAPPPETGKPARTRSQLTRDERADVKRTRGHFRRRPTSRRLPESDSGLRSHRGESAPDFVFDTALPDECDD